MTWKHLVLSSACGMLTAYWTRSTSRRGPANVSHRLTVEFEVPGTERRRLSTSVVGAGMSTQTLHSGRLNVQCWSTRQCCRRLMLSSLQSLCSDTQPHDLPCDNRPSSVTQYMVVIQRCILQHSFSLTITILLLLVRGNVEIKFWPVKVCRSV